MHFFDLHKPFHTYVSARTRASSGSRGKPVAYVKMFNDV